MEIRKMAELYALYPEAQPGIRYDSPELLMIQYISEGSTEKVLTLFREKCRFSENPPAVDAPWGRFEGREQIHCFAEGFIARFEADGLTILPEFPAGVGRKSQDTL